MVWGLLAAVSLAALGPDAAVGGARGAARVVSAPLVERLRISPALDLSGAGGGSLMGSSGSHGVDSGVACVAGALVPGLGHAILGEYLPRGLAFTSAFAATLIGSITALTHAQDSPRLRGQLLFAGLVMMLAANVIYLWSVIDALMISSNPRRARRGPEILLGRD